MVMEHFAHSKRDSVAGKRVVEKNDESPAFHSSWEVRNKRKINKNPIVRVCQVLRRKIIKDNGAETRKKK